MPRGCPIKCPPYFGWTRLDYKLVSCSVLMKRKHPRPFHCQHERHGTRPQYTNIVSIDGLNLFHRATRWREMPIPVRKHKKTTKQPLMPYIPSFASGASGTPRHQTLERIVAHLCACVFDTGKKMHGICQAKTRSEIGNTVTVWNIVEQPATWMGTEWHAKWQPSCRGKRIALSAVVLTRSERRLSTRFDRRHVKDFGSVYECTQRLVNVYKLSWIEPEGPQAARFGHRLNETTSTLNMCSTASAST